MGKLIELNNVSYSKNNNVILNSINLEINEGDFISIVGPNSAGKTTLVRIMLGFEECKGSITYYNGLQRKQFLDLVGMVFENSSYSFLCDTVYDEIAFNLKNKGFNQETIKTKVEEISEYLKITDLLECIPNSLSGGKKLLVSLAATLVSDPKLIIIDDSFDMVDSITKDKLMALLKKINRDKKCTIIFTTSSLEDSLVFNRLVLLSEGNILLDNKVKESFDNIKLFKAVGLSLPFMVDLSNKLQYYELIDKIEFSMDKLVNKLWK